MSTDFALQLTTAYCDRLHQQSGIVTHVLPEQTSQAIVRVASWITDIHARPGLILLGGVGTGKTTLMRALKDTLLNVGATSRFFLASEFGTLFFDNQEQTEYQLLQGNWCKFLLLDDIGTEPRVIKEYGNAIEPFNRIVEARYFNCLPLVFTTNLSLEEIGNTYGERIADRLAEMCDVITFNGESYRRKTTN